MTPRVHRAKVVLRDGVPPVLRPCGTTLQPARNPAACPGHDYTSHQRRSARWRSPARPKDANSSSPSGSRRGHRPSGHPQAAPPLPQRIARTRGGRLPRRILIRCFTFSPQGTTDATPSRKRDWRRAISLRPNGRMTSKTSACGLRTFEHALSAHPQCLSFHRSPPDNAPSPQFRLMVEFDKTIIKYPNIPRFVGGASNDLT